MNICSWVGTTGFSGQSIIKPSGGVKSRFLWPDGPASDERGSKAEGGSGQFYAAYGRSLGRSGQTARSAPRNGRSLVSQSFDWV